MTFCRPAAVLVAVPLAGAAGTLAVGAAAGMGADELGHLALILLPAGVASAVAALVARRLLARSSLRVRLLALALLGTLVGLANLAVLSKLMFVSAHDAQVLGILLFYSAGVSAVGALALSRASTEAVERLAAAAERLADGDLDARVGQLGAGAELDEVAAALDRMAGRLGASLARERRIEGQRRDLITAVSHDLRTPLTGLRAMIETVDEGLVDDAETLRRYVTDMRGSVDALVSLVDDLFEFVQLEAAQIERELEPVRLEQAVRAALAACELQASEKGLVVQTDIDSATDVPCSPHLARVIQNLVQNAIRHTPADGTVRMAAHQASDRLEVVVEDTGEGIDADPLDRVFEPFWRGDAARHDPGTGLGLALAKRIVEGLGGEISVDSEPARGSRFAFVVPSHG